MPQVASLGGSVLHTPVLQSITFSGYDQIAAIDDFVATIGTTSYWPSAVGEYGVGTPTVQAPVHLAEAAPTTIDDSAIQTWLQQKVAAGGGFMPASASALYVISYPASTTITLQGMTSCTQFGGYHSSTTIGGVTVAYAVVPECTYPGMTTLQTITSAASHELAEACTDPSPFASPAYAQPDDAHTYMAVILGGGEIGDMCAQFPSSFFTPPGYAYMVQRPWSNAAASAGRDPCQPELPGEVFFNSVPLATDTVTITYQGSSFSTGGIKIAQGASRTIPVQLYSEVPSAGSWSVTAVNWPNTAANLSFAWDRTTGQNGDTLQLTITVQSFDATYGGDSFVVESTMGSTTNYWVGYVAP
jgi:hypothetical protein